MYKTEKLENFKIAVSDDYDVIVGEEGIRIPSVIRSVKREYVLDETLLGSGSYGMVFQYISSDRQYSIMMKLFTDSGADTCLDTSQYLSSTKCPGARYVLKQRCITPKALSKNNAKFVIMESMNGDLGSLALAPVGLSKRVDMCINVISGIRCLQSKNKNLNYIDIKPGNILFKVVNGDRIKICVGDLEVCSSTHQISTYRPPKEWAEGSFKQGCTEAVSVWGLMLLILWIFKKEGVSRTNPYLIHWKNSKSKADKNVKGRLKKLQKLVTAMPKLNNKNPKTYMIIETFESCLSKRSSSFEELKKALLSYKKLLK
uniref:Protein kinase domain-containing protein n=1 Tax=viral metagenome TaxID=1070528 RepID=A0A6C0KBE9_9ZZZZ